MAVPYQAGDKSVMLNRVTKSNSYELVSQGFNEVPYTPGDHIGGEGKGNSVRPRDTSKNAYSQDCFCHKKGN